MMAAYMRFFCTKEQPNKPARSAMQGLGSGRAVGVGGN
jgi:hypothetical protein